MGARRIGRIARLGPAFLVVLAGGCVSGSGHLPTILAEQRDLAVRDPAQLPPAPIPNIPPPTTIATPLQENAPARKMSLDDAIRTSLANSRVVRVLAGEQVVSSGQTIFEPAIANTRIDQEAGAFDPNVIAAATYGQLEQADPIRFPGIPAWVLFQGARADTTDLFAGVIQRTPSGAIVGADVRHTNTSWRGGDRLLNSLTSSSAGVSLTQPLLRGAGSDVNMAPVVIARINTERSFFQFKDAVQELIRSVVQAYWAVVSARIDAWARRQQVVQAERTLEWAEARGGFEPVAQVALARSSLATFRANLIAAEANVLQREATLRNLLGVPPSDQHRLVLTTSPSETAIEPNWDELLRLAEQRRPDIAELKLILDADQQRMIVAENLTLPQVDATARFRQGGLEGEGPLGQVSTGKGELTDWAVGVNLAVPLGLRQGRASLREAELIIARDRANLQQGLHAAAHDLAESVRGLAQAYAQYRAYQKARSLARESLEKQLDVFQTKAGGLYLNVLQAIAEWGNAVSAEGFALAQYNTELARLARQTGTILDAHEIRFFEEKYYSVGPLGKHGPSAEYPEAMIPTLNANRYPITTDGPEAALEKDKPKLPKGPRDLPPPREVPPPKNKPEVSIPLG